MIPLKEGIGKPLTFSSFKDLKLIFLMELESSLKGP
jgi:hypothetical protein